MTGMPSENEMYRAVEEKDESYVGVFVVAVRSTRIFCRPGCPARLPLQKNVEFFRTASAALHAGYRPCKRCHPMDAGIRPPDWVKTLMRQIDDCPEKRITDWDLRQLGINPETARRTFKSRYGMTFQAYSRSRRMGQALKHVREGQDAFTTALDNGYESDSGFRDAFEKVFGVTTKAASGVSVMQCRWLETPLGPMLAAANQEGLCLLEFVDRRMLETQLKVLKKRLDCVMVPGENPFLDQTARELDEYFAGTRRTFDVPLVIKGSPFQERVWGELLKIPYGSVVSYLDTARALGDTNAVRAVGKANGDNRIAIIVPCHRVIKADGSLCGYGGGLWRKQRLLELESGQAVLL